MTTTEELQAVRSIEDAIAKAALMRINGEEMAQKYTADLIRLLPVAKQAGLSMTRIAQLSGVSRQTVYRWEAS
jgi:predicted transcriptional regulator